MKTTLLIASLAAGVTLAATAEARDGRGMRAELPTFEQLDLNADGQITTTEVESAMQAMAAARFAQADTDGDGALSAEEMIARAEAMASDRRADRMANRIADHIERADTNGDGMLQQDEMTARAAERGEDRRNRGPERIFERFDADDNGTLSAEEFAEAQTRMGERGPRHDN